MLVDAVETAQEFIAKHGGVSFSTKLRERFDSTSAAYGPAIAVQHFRNLVLGCAFSSGPADLQQLVDQQADRNSRRLAHVIPALDRALIDHFLWPEYSSERIAEHGPDPSVGRCLLVVNYVPLKSAASHLRLIVGWATLLAMRDATAAICVLVTQELNPEAPRTQDGGIDAKRIEEWQEEMLQFGGRDLASKVTFATPDRVGPVWPYDRSLALARDFQPDLILAFQGIYRSHVVPDVLGADAPIVAIQCNTGNPEPSLCDLVLAHGHRPHFDDEPHPAKWRSYTIPVLPYEKTTHVSACEFDPAHHLRIVTALGHGRLGNALLAEHATLLRRIVDFLAAHEEVLWLMIGEPDVSRLHEALGTSRADELDGRLRFLPRIPDLRAVFEHCHIYMHPPENTGGGMTIAMAAAEGLPVIAPANNDAANFLPAETLCESRDDAFAWLERLTSSEELRDQTSKRQRRWMETNNSLQNASTSLDPLLVDANANFTVRTAATH